MLSLLRLKVFVVVIAVCFFCLNTNVSANPIVRIDGSSTVYPIIEAVAEDFQIAKRGSVRVTVGISGTGGGFKKFCRGELDIVNASRAITELEMQVCKKTGVQYIEMPIAFDALTVAINPRNNWSETMKIDELKQIWEPGAQGEINNWRQINSDWPDKKIKLYGAGADSGTFEYFTEAIVGRAKSSRGDFTASEDDNVLVQGVASDKYALGFFGFAYYIENKNKIKAVAIDSGSGGVIPSAETVENGSYQPLSRPVFIYVNAQSTGKSEVQDFVKFFMENAAELVAEVKYFPLSPKIYDNNLMNMKKKKVGTVFSGESEVGVNIEEVMKHNARM
ncbi:PstS family phosphate ABC transporter substrate-binding protein [Nitrosomonas aestuarii]|uniref:Phosphate-binding protein n=1 Tax=Nitrosomonas aestuarii TaxID=52441 RepID=A0A1I4D3N9_9PROT|nr:PstS family phosphate ABC transporter substrate-binding protein [Nitrosomonas aestuarii]PTN09159.1 phosphate ABC transporter substrate-binding protein (PhoT family) [Nitrosomonas aestuarii]SFK88122.1 phosphate ABC transporter substrate-binding protein, PhoT family [Nitrosomonas aestuarii]